MKKTALFLTLLTLLVSIGCVDHTSSIPERDVYLNRYLYDCNLLIPGSFLRVTETNIASERLGFGGILVYYGMDNMLYAFDLACPHEANPQVRIGLPNETGLCRCDSCGEEYDVAWGMGTPTKGISKEPLKRYTVRLNEYNYVVVTR